MFLGVCWYQLFLDVLWERVWGMLLLKLLYLKCSEALIFFDYIIPLNFPVWQNSKKAYQFFAW